MPLYEYDCIDCGPFKSWRPMAEAGELGDCPGCAAPAPRALARPHTRNTSAGLRYFAAARNERSAHEPMTERRLKVGTGHGHAPGHQHRHGHARPHRPWMVGHQH